MSIRVGTIVSINDAYNSYQRQIKQLKSRKIKSTDPKEIKQIDYSIKMLEMEVDEFLQVVIPDPQLSKKSPYLAIGYDSLYSNEPTSLDIEV